MPRIHARQRFDAPPAAVFAALSDHAAFLSGGAVRCRLLREGDAARDGVGAVREVRTGGLVFVEDIVAFEPPRHDAYLIRTLSTTRGWALPIHHERGWLEFAADGGDTVVDWHSRFQIAVPLLGRVFAPLVALRIRRGFDALLARAARRLAAGV
ncbi:MAG: SRPBCC family protein [Pseudomonadota bacterium]